MWKILIYQIIIILFFIKNFCNRIRKLISKNQTPLHIVAETNSKEIGEILISKGADINAETIICQIILPLLIIAIVILIKIILNKLKKWNHKNSTPLHYAAKYKSKEIVEILLLKGDNIQAEDNDIHFIITIYNLWRQFNFKKWTILNYGLDPTLEAKFTSKRFNINAKDIIFKLIKII